MNDNERISIENILKSNHLLSMASIKEGESYINTAFFSCDKDFNLYYLSDPEKLHVKNIQENPSVAVTVFDSHLTFKDDLKGLQVFGTSKKASGKELVAAFTTYAKRYSVFRNEIKDTEDLKKLWHSTFYIIIPESIKILDEEIFGAETWVTVTI